MPRALPFAKSARLQRDATSGFRSPPQLEHQDLNALALRDYYWVIPQKWPVLEFWPDTGGGRKS